MRRNIEIVILIALLGIPGCLSQPPEEIVIERSCHIEPLPPKQSLPAVHYEHITQDGIEFLCLDKLNADFEKERELRLRQDIRVCREAYERAIKRCTKEDHNHGK